jgi:hypothetical protein
MIQKLALTILVPKLINEVYDFVKSKLVETKPTRDTTKITPQMKRDINLWYSCWKANKPGFEFNNRNEFTKFVNSKLGTNKSVTTIFRYINNVRSE